MFTEEDFYILNHHEKPTSSYSTVKNVLLPIILVVDALDTKPCGYSHPLRREILNTTFHRAYRYKISQTMWKLQFRFKT